MRHHNGMDWKRAFAIYLSKVTSPISDVLLEYMNDFHNSVAQAPPPFPPYMEARGDTPLSPLDIAHASMSYCITSQPPNLTFYKNVLLGDLAPFTQDSNPD